MVDMVVVGMIVFAVIAILFAQAYLNKAKSAQTVIDEMIMARLEQYFQGIIHDGVTSLRSILGPGRTVEFQDAQMTLTPTEGSQGERSFNVEYLFYSPKLRVLKSATLRCTDRYWVISISRPGGPSKFSTHCYTRPTYSFKLNLKHPMQPMTVRGATLAEACRTAGLNKNTLALLESYELDGTTIEVAGQAKCGCVHHAVDGLACTHDLDLAGLS